MRFIVTLLLVAVIATPCARAGELLYFQQDDSQSTYGPSQFWPAGGINSEVADDFEVIAAVDRVTAGGFIWRSSPQWGGVFVRFYEYRADGTPGVLQREYFLAIGDPNLTVTNFGLVDAILSPPFAASGRHFLAVQAQVDEWYWWSSGTNAPRGQAFYFRNLADGQTAWQHGDGLNYYPNADVEFALYGQTTGAGVIGSLSAVTLARSGHLEIFGTNLGGDGTVLIGGVPAPIGQWTSTRVVAYVPEMCPLGTVDVQVVTAGGTSNSKPLGVTDRQPNGRVNWRLRMEGMYSQVRPARGPDGTVYAVDVGFRLYAVKPDGGLKWIVRGAGNKGLNVGADGTIYTASESDVSAYFPDGTLKWKYDMNPRAFIMHGPNVGPDGNVYGVAVEGIGVFSLTPAGQLRWSTPERYDRPITDYEEISFGSNNGQPQLYFTANNHTRAVRLQDGASIFTIGRIGKPEVSALDNTVHGSSAAWSPSGQLIWSFTFPIYTGYVSACELANDGTHYVVNRFLELYALNPNGTEKWHTTFGSSMGTPNIDPANSMLILGNSSTLDHPAFIVGFSLASRSAAWQVDLPAEDTHIYNTATGLYGFNHFVDSRARFSADGSTVYLTTAIATGGITTDRSFLYSIATGSSTPPSPATLRTTAIDLSGKPRKNEFTITGLVTVVNETGAPVSSATVNAEYVMPNGSIKSQSGMTDSKGVARFMVNGPSGAYVLRIRNVTRTGSVFDPTASLMGRSITVGATSQTRTVSLHEARFGAPTIVEFTQPEPGQTELAIYGVTGRLVRSLFDEDLPAGTHRAAWDGRDDTGNMVPAGVYFLMMTNGGEILTRKTVIMR